MDFLIVGIGTGASAMLAGFALRARGAFWLRAGTLRPVDLATDRAVRAWGGALVVGGVAVAAITLGALFLAPDDAAGAVAVAVGGLACAVATFALGRHAARQAAASSSVASVTAPARRTEVDRGRASAAPRTAATRRPPARRPAAPPGPVPRPAPASPPAARPVPAAPAFEEFDPAMALAHAEDRRQPASPAIAADRVARDPRIAPGVDREVAIPAPPMPAYAARRLPAPAPAPSAPVPAASASASADANVNADAGVGVGDDRDAAFAVIPLFRESEQDDARESAFAPIGGLRAVDGRPLPWETMPAQEDEFFVDPALAAEGRDDLPPPIPFARPASRG